MRVAIREPDYNGAFLRQYGQLEWPWILAMCNFCLSHAHIDWVGIHERIS
jgi:hypothetical protein